MAKKSARAFSLIMAVVFLVSTLAFTGAVIWQIYQDGKDDTQEVSQTTPNQSTEERTLDNFEPVQNVTKLETTDLTEGDGAVVKKSDTVTVHYTGALAATGVIFESSKDAGQPVTFGLDQVIEGWGEGIPGMKVGGTRRLIIPADLAYGAQSPSPDIPPNSALVFDVEVLSVGQ
jgi:FKBP-type peptidyl-prolyl cis-trans isomerase